MSCNSVQGLTQVCEKKNWIPWNIQWISMGPVWDHHMRLYMWWSHVWIWTYETPSQTNKQCLFGNHFLPTTTNHACHHHPPHSSPPLPSWLPMNANDHQWPHRHHDCPKNEADHPQTKMAAHIQPSTTGHEWWPAAMYGHGQWQTKVSKLTSPSQSF